MSEQTLRFRWAACFFTDFADAFEAVATSRAERRWSIQDLTIRRIKRPTELSTHVLELEWVYGPVRGASVNDGRRFISLVLVETFGLDVPRPERYLLDSDVWPDVTLLGSPA